MSPLARASQTSFRTLARTSPSHVRTLYTNREHVAHNNFPFSYENKRKFAVKIGASLTVAFLVPFIAAGYQL
ncbi:hypothetical protein BD310DRAFT_939147 [Dichomitus squalens]|nr:hypothetical protein BD310DRAFT_939147 [Dichomitus squalens]